MLRLKLQADCKRNPELFLHPSCLITWECRPEFEYAFHKSSDNWYLAKVISQSWRCKIDDNADLAVFIELKDNPASNNDDKKSNTQGNGGEMISQSCSMQNCNHFWIYTLYCDLVLFLHEASIMLMARVPYPHWCSCCLIHGKLESAVCCKEDEFSVASGTA